MIPKLVTLLEGKRQLVRVVPSNSSRPATVTDRWRSATAFTGCRDSRFRDSSRSTGDDRRRLGRSRDRTRAGTPPTTTFSAETVDEVVDDWYAIGDLESTITDISGREGRRISRRRTSAGTAVRYRGRSGSEPRGFAHAVPWPEDTTVVFLARLYVRPDDWNEGIGTALLERLEADFSTAVDRIRLAVLAANQVGISFYESRGFDCVATRSSDLAAGLEEHVYERQLSTPDE